MQTIEGEILFHEVLSSFTGATVYVFLEDVSRMDVSSTEVARVVLSNISLNRDRWFPIRFVMSHPPLDENAHYSLSVLVDVDGNGRVSRGDYISTESIPVPSEEKRVVQIYVKPVT